MKTTTIALFGVILAIAGPLTCGDVASASRAPREGGGLDLTPRKPMWAFDCRSLRTVNGRAVLLGEMSWRADGDAISVSLVRASRSAYLFAIVLDASTGSRRRSFVLKRGGPTHTWNPTGRLLAARNRRNGTGESVLIWEVPKRKLHSRLDVRSGAISALAWSPNGKQLAIAAGGSIEIWDTGVSQMSTVLAAHERFISALVWSPDGRFIASRSSGIRIWDVARRSLVCSLAQAKRRTGRRLRWSSDSRVIAAGASANHDVMLRVWDARTGRLLLRHDIHIDRVTHLRWQPGGQLAASADREGTVVHLWNWREPDQTRRLEGHAGEISAVDWGPGGSLLAVGDTSGAVTVWNAATQKRVTRLISGKSAVDGLAWSPDGSRLAAFSRDCRFTMWDTSSLAARGGSGGVASPSD